MGVPAAQRQYDPQQGALQTPNRVGPGQLLIPSVHPQLAMEPRVASSHGHAGCLLILLASALLAADDGTDLEVASHEHSLDVVAWWGRGGRDPEQPLPLPLPPDSRHGERGARVLPSFPAGGCVGFRKCFLIAVIVSTELLFYPTFTCHHTLGLELYVQFPT